VLLYGNNRIAYVVTAERAVEILGVFHGRLEIARYLPSASR
jgi:plasmid stabilization system protein ParE